MVEIITLNKSERIKTVCIKKGAKYHYFKGDVMVLLLKWINTDDIKLKHFINSLR